MIRLKSEYVSTDPCKDYPQLVFHILYNHNIKHMMLLKFIIFLLVNIRPDFPSDIFYWNVSFSSNKREANQIFD